MPEFAASTGTCNSSGRCSCTADLDNGAGTVQ
jgi:hypothetical protein